MIMVSGSQSIACSPYEAGFSAFIGSGVYPFSFWKGRVALYAILRAMNVQPDEEIILPGYTCVVVPNAVRLCGAKPIYVDIDMDTFSIDPALLEAAITEKTRAILVQHTYGIPGPIYDVMEIAKKHNLFVIEDSAHALGSSINGKLLGAIGDAAFFSSQWSKPYTSGLGGIAVSRDPDIANEIQKVRSNFELPSFGVRAKLSIQYALFSLFYSPRNFWFAQGLLRKLSKWGVFVGSSSTEELEGLSPQDHHWIMGPFQERVGIRQLEKYKEDLPARKKLMAFYRQGLIKAGWPALDYDDETILLRYPVRVKNKWDLLDKAQDARVELGSWFESPLHPIKLEDHAIFDYTLGQCPISEQAAEETINLPLHQWMTPEEAQRTLNFVLENGNPV